MKHLTYAPDGNIYDVFIGAGSRESLKHLLPPQSVFVIRDQRVPLSWNLDGAIDICIEGGEGCKTLDQVEKLANQIIAQGAHRQSVLVAVGGGSVGDLVGFLASVLFRGISWAFLPTTLLAQADVALGGKTAVNVLQGKNLIGSFHFPKWVICDVDFLDTLSPREIASGMAEIIKHAVIADPVFFNQLCHLKPPYPWADIVAKSLAIKHKVIGDDWYENGQGQRILLNLGHTFGHAYEAIAGFKDLTHGEAVGLGMMTAMHVSCSLGCVCTQDLQAVQDILTQYHLPTDFAPWLRHPSFENYFLADKKHSKDSVRIVIPEKIGQAKPHVFANYAQLKVAI